VCRTSKEHGDAAAASVSSKHGVKAVAYQAPVEDPKAIEEAVTSAVADFGKLDIMVVNAGVGAEFEALTCTPEWYREQMAINLDGAFYTAQAAAKVFKAQGSGNMIFTTSISAVLVNGPQDQAIV
jgi:sorbose reductase